MPRKLSLDLMELHVETFQTSPEPTPGTGMNGSRQVISIIAYTVLCTFDCSQNTLCKSDVQ